MPLIAVFNPDNGPGKDSSAQKKAVTEYLPSLKKVRGAGGKVYAYIASRTNSNADGSLRSLSSIQADINAYVSLYKPNFDGFFIDQMSNDNNSAHIGFYKSIYTFIKSVSSSYTVMGNPGANVVSGYATPWPQTADQFVLFEDSADNYKSYNPAAWQSGMPTNRFVHMVYGVAQSDLTSTLSFASSHDASSVYLTTDSAYDSLPSYWNTLVADVAAMNR